MSHPPPPREGFLAGLGLRSQMTALIATALVAVAAVAGTAYLDAKTAASSALKVFVAKDVTADILPPPMYLVELRLVLSQAAEGSMPPSQAQEEVRRLTSEYQARVKYWQDNPPYGLEADLLGRQHVAGEAFLVSAARAADAIAGGADGVIVKAAMQAAHADYVGHRAGVDATVMPDKVGHK